MTALGAWGGRLARGLMLAGRAVAPGVWRLAVAWVALVVLAELVAAAPGRVDQFDILSVGPWDTSWVAPWAGLLQAMATLVVWILVALVALVLALSLGLPDSVAAWIGRRDVRRSFVEVARAAGLSDRVDDGNESRWIDPRLLRVTSQGGVVTARVRARRGQTSTDLVAGAEKLAAGVDAAAFRASSVSPSVADVRLTMMDALAGSTTAALPTDRPLGAALDPADVGRDESGMPWQLSLVGKHTLVAGRSGSGKGSVLWGAVASLAPWIAQDTVRVHGVDLKRGVEIAMGDGLMYRTAYRPEQALVVLRDLLTIIDERASRMVGQSRLHEPTPGDPLHLLVIDELAALTAYADVEVKKEGNRLLAEILTQGRAMGVVVVAFVQDPKKETVPARGLFTQTIALRLASADEVRMVLGQGMSDEAPAHRIPADMPGTGYLVTEEGSVARVRAHYWSDALIKATAAHFPAAERWIPPLDQIAAAGPVHHVQTTQIEGGEPSRPRERRPRSPRSKTADNETTNVVALKGVRDGAQ
ncbi:FtsK/SpoIIIE domain-containing protein [Janibacter limosus]|uniref:FtsK/SpoIIIE domain-containing protein n=1 Tax=Janibacter limosus TaxID=53458 RepID=UPI000A600AF7|nr:FtsK/SpoIIIE domain-containing protein [Janibacter limosus]